MVRLKNYVKAGRTSLKIAKIYLIIHYESSRLLWWLLHYKVEKVAF